jgi:hypothetical protein
MIKAGLTDQMESVRRNCAYCVGVLVQATGLALAPHFMSILQALYPLCTRSVDKMTSDTGGADVDNALSSVARIINVGGPALIPLPQVLPALLAALPLRSDTSEGPNIYGCLCDLVSSSDPSALALLPSILHAFGQTLLSDSNAVDEVSFLNSHAYVYGFFIHKRFSLNRLPSLYYIKCILYIFMIMYRLSSVLAYV